MQCSEHGSGNQGTGPYHAAGADEIAPGDASEGVAQYLGGEDEQHLVHDAEVLAVEFDLFDNDLWMSAVEEGQLAGSHTSVAKAKPNDTLLLT